MKVVAADLRPYSVGFAGEMVTSGGSPRQRRGIIVRVGLSCGIAGLGEIAPLENYSIESLRDAYRSADELVHRVAGVDVPADFGDLRALIVDIAGADFPPSVIFGMETALADAAARASSVPLCRWIFAGAVDRVPVNAVLSGDASTVAAQVEYLSESGFGTFKLKVGARSPDSDLETVAYMRKRLGEQATIRLDANGAWEFDQAAAFLTRLTDHRIEFVEEPLTQSALQRIDDLHRATGFTFALDETIRDRALWENVLESDAVSAVVIKPTLAGGISKARLLCDRARALGKTTIITSTLESGVGVSACLHLAASLGVGVSPCGLDTLRFLSDTLILEQLTVVNGSLGIGAAPGLGATLKSGLFDREACSQPL